MFSKLVNHSSLNTQQHNLSWGVLMAHCLREITPSYILHTRAFGTYLLGGVIYLAKKIIR
jgi:hypothetical protein